ncbi:hypothetical protein E2C01_030573 [Portunus trituberculatus]|uniref:Uncharacterized protein n=1 Tax=Portunus trituberculatus TaxID=210409 RepID=A0A5B7EVP4_PORTR|nr:hypothetical protein [Portunus trituberculatus]
MTASPVTNAASPVTTISLSYHHFGLSSPLSSVNITTTLLRIITSQSHYHGITTTSSPPITPVLHTTATPNTTTAHIQHLTPLFHITTAAPPVHITTTPYHCHFKSPS